MTTAQPAGEASSAPGIRFRSARKRVLLTSLALGIFVLLAVPIHSASIADPGVLTDERYVFAVCRWPFPLVPESACPQVFAGESPFMVLYALVIVPLLLIRGGARTMLTIAVLSLIFTLVQLEAAFYTALPSVFFPPSWTPISFLPRSCEIPPPADWCFVGWTIPYSTLLRCPYCWPWRSSATGLIRALRGERGVLR
jgi:hypothetical protein